MTTTNKTTTGAPAKPARGIIGTYALRFSGYESPGHFTQRFCGWIVDVIGTDVLMHNADTLHSTSLPAKVHSWADVKECQFYASREAAEEAEVRALERCNSFLDRELNKVRTAAIACLDPSNPLLWDKDGKATLNALRGLKLSCDDEFVQYALKHGYITRSYIIRAREEQAAAKAAAEATKRAIEAARAEREAVANWLVAMPLDIAATGLQDAIAKLVQTKRITPPYIKEIYANHGVARSMDTTPEMRLPIMQAILKKCAEIAAQKEAEEAAKLAAEKAEARTNEIRKAIMRLDPSNDDHWTDGGLPRVYAVETGSGVIGVTRKEIADLARDLNRDCFAEWVKEQTRKLATA